MFLLSFWFIQKNTIKDIFTSSFVSVLTRNINSEECSGLIMHTYWFHTLCLIQDWDTASWQIKTAAILECQSGDLRSLKRCSHSDWNSYKDMISLTHMVEVSADVMTHTSYRRHHHTHWKCKGKACAPACKKHSFILYVAVMCWQNQQ